MPHVNKQDIILDCAEFVAINKPAGMLSIPDRKQSEPSLKDLLKEMYPEVFTVHRLDKDTSGLILFAKNAVAHKYLCDLFTERKIIKKYIGVVIGEPNASNGSITAPIGENPAKKGTMNVHRLGKPAHTDYTVLEAYSKYALVEFELHTGRTHQIRVHAKEIGHPLACDPIYGDGKPVFLSQVKKKYNLAKKEEEERPVISRMALHSFSLEFVSPSGEEMKLEAPVPKIFRALMQQLKKNS